MSKYISKTKVLYVFEFLIFLVLILKAPVVGDRWMERSAGVSLEYPLRIIFAQVRWVELVNGRVFSNLFSFLVDGYSVYLRAIVNASMLVLISVLINKICSLKTLLGIIVPFLVSFGIWIQVYYYATTFYVSSALILVLWVYILEYEIIDLSTKKQYVLLCLFAFVSSMWVENLSILLLCIWGGYYLKKLVFKDKSKRYFGVALVGFIGLILMFCSAHFAKYGRLSVERQAKEISLELIKIGEVFIQEYILFVFLSVVMLRLLFFNKKKNKFIFIHIIIWGFTLCLNLILVASRIYEIISTDPINLSYVDAIVWFKFERLFINDFFLEVSTILIYLSLAVVPICLTSLFFVIKQLCSTQKSQLYILIFSNVTCFVLTMLFMYQINDSRMILIFEILLGLIICLLNIQVEKTKKNNEFYLILLIVAISFWCQYAFIEPFSKISKERIEVAHLVKDKQRLGEWDFEKDEMYFPSYKKYNTGDGITSNRYNPSVDDIYYTFMLRYYELDTRTEILYIKSN